ncbi:2Fe-2S iron-sulfur cluster-binding protein [Hymenobacter caeli]|uniref:Xanthine dehydrogenase small subunit n=1 Tax=Hymenobacter caeli TaxID=2735894 RepID=A0ABX2FJE0_9BACT|nr:2Fe-2S iron-sulfur cluster-binding protein [Hymenobacter caeli]NRT17233.1 xanthine dehydrogenase small subunit [Hymenobacter caeli]
MITFYLNDQPVHTAEPAASALLDFVRYHEHLTGTKTGCREGDCGACAVLVGEPAADGQRIAYQSMTSCLTPLGNVHGKHVVTVEGINPAGGQLTPVQQAIVDEGGAQCGFCTTGFVMALTGHSLAETPVTAQSTRAAIDGNICRCTGYKSLERAAAALTAGLAGRPVANSLPWLTERQFVPAYFHQMPALLGALRTETGAAAAPEAPTTNGHANGHANGAAAPVSTSPNGHAQAQNGHQHSPIHPFTHSLIGGGTDMLVQRLEELRGQPVRLLFDQSERRGIRHEAGAGRVVLGAATTASHLLESALLCGLLPRLPAYLKLVSSTPIRNMGTVAGNFVNASPIGDLTILFLALGADITLLDAAGAQRVLPLAGLYLGYKKLAKAADEQIIEIGFPAPLATDFFNYEKVSKRTHLDIASVNTAAWLRLENGVITAARLSAGGVGPVPLLLVRTGTYLLGRELSTETAAGANEVMQEEISPISDVRGTAQYKRLLARQLLFAHFLRFAPEMALGELI